MQTPTAAPHGDATVEPDSLPASPGTARAAGRGLPLSIRIWRCTNPVCRHETRDPIEAAPPCICEQPIDGVETMCLAPFAPVPLVCWKCGPVLELAISSDATGPLCADCLADSQLEATQRIPVESMRAMVFGTEAA